MNGNTTTAQVAANMPNRDIRSVQRLLLKLVDAELLTRQGSGNKPSYRINYHTLLLSDVNEQYLEDETRPGTSFNFSFLDWLKSAAKSNELQLLGHNLLGAANIAPNSKQLTPKELEYLTIELSWKSSALEGNTYTLVDTQLLLMDGIKAKNKTDFETQMILNHKNAIAFIVENGEYFKDNIAFKTVEELHRILTFNLGIEQGIRKQLVRITASNYVPMANRHQLKELMNESLGIINLVKDPVLRSLLVLAVVPYIQSFEDGNKRLGRVLANAILINSIGRGFSLRKVEAKELALAYLSFYEFNSLKGLADILTAELDQA
jgi:Fic family protein